MGESSFEFHLSPRLDTSTPTTAVYKMAIKLQYKLKSILPNHVQPRNALSKQNKTSCQFPRCFEVRARHEMSYILWLYLFINRAKPKTNKLNTCRLLSECI